MPFPARGRRPLLTALALLLLTSLPLPAARAQELAELESIMIETAAVRELPPLSRLEPRFLTPAEAQAEIESLVLAEWDAAAVAATTRAAAAFGLMPEDTDLLAVNLALLGEQVGGFYDPESDRIVVIQDAEFGALGTYIFSHEVTHALQGEYLGLGDVMHSAADTSGDAQLAQIALYEGDATLASALFIGSKPLLALQLGAESMTAAIPTEALDQAPPIIALGLIFPYLSGLPFVQALQAEGGWAAVDVAYATPPVSTEQILHPEKYLAGEQPVPVTLPEAAATLGAGWEEIDSDTLGEFQVGVLLANLAPGEGMDMMTGAIALPAPATRAAAGWAGDTYGFWVNGDAQALVWQTAWDTEQDASEFIVALRHYDEARFGAELTVTGERELTLELPDQVIRIAQQGTSVSYVQAPTIDDAAAVMAALSATPPGTPAAARAATPGA